MVEYAKEYRARFLPQLLAAALVIIALFVFAYYTGFTREYCGTDTTCFLEKAQSCKPVELFYAQNNNVYTYTILPRPTDECVMKVSLDSVQEGALLEHKLLLEGKEMTCTIPKEKMQTLEMEGLNELFQYCTGPLKEALYELMLKRMYELVITNLAEITEEAKKVMQI